MIYFQILQIVENYFKEFIFIDIIYKLVSNKFFYSLFEKKNKLFNQFEIIL